MSGRRKATWAAAVLAIPLALALVVLAIDVLRTPGALERDDVRFEAAPSRQQGLWDGVGLAPGVVESLVELDDDLDYRRTMARIHRVQPGKVEIFGLSGQVQLALTQGSAEDANPQRRAQYLNLLATMTLARFGSDQAEAETTLRRAIHLLRAAVETDPQNAEAKLNLELALRNAKATNLPGTDPSGDAAEGTISGQGRSGTGY